MTYSYDGSTAIHNRVRLVFVPYPVSKEGVLRMPEGARTYCSCCCMETCCNMGLLCRKDYMLPNGTGRQVHGYWKESA